MHVVLPSNINAPGLVCGFFSLAFYPTGETTAACFWSNEVRTFSYVLQVYLPLVVRNAP